MLDIVSLLVSLIVQPHNRSTDSLVLAPFRTCLPHKLQKDQRFDNCHLVHHKFWNPKELEWMHCLLWLRLDQVSLCHRTISLVDLEDNHEDKVHTSNFQRNW